MSPLPHEAPAAPTPPVTTGAEFDAHRRIVTWLFLATLGVVSPVATLLILSFAQGRPYATCLMMVFAAGTLGGFVSALRRLYAFSRIFPRPYLAAWPGASAFYLVAYSSIPPLIGAIAAVVVYLIFAGGMLNGPLFPVFHWAPSDQKFASEFLHFLSDWDPDSPASYAKAIVWGFVAGFSEKFVPDILNQLGSTPAGGSA